METNRRQLTPVPRRGRPRSTDPGVSVKTWLRASEYDRLIKAAAERREPVSSLVRSLLILRLP
jgi:hypothetical protein